MLRITSKTIVQVMNCESKINIKTVYNDGTWIGVSYDYISDLICTKNSSGWSSGYHEPDSTQRKYVWKIWNEYLSYIVKEIDKYENKISL